MAIVQNTIIGRASGSAGDITFVTLNRENIIKEKIKNPRDPKTPKQLKQRAVYRRWLDLFAIFKNVFKKYFKTRKKLNILNQWIKQNTDVNNQTLYKDCLSTLIAQPSLANYTILNPKVYYDFAKKQYTITMKLQSIYNIGINNFDIENIVLIFNKDNEEILLKSKTITIENKEAPYDIKLEIKSIELADITKLHILVKQFLAFDKIISKQKNISPIANIVIPPAVNTLLTNWFNEITIWEKYNNPDSNYYYTKDAFENDIINVLLRNYDTYPYFDFKTLSLDDNLFDSFAFEVDTFEFTYPNRYFFFGIKISLDNFDYNADRVMISFCIAFGKYKAGQQDTKEYYQLTTNTNRYSLSAYGVRDNQQNIHLQLAEVQFTLDEAGWKAFVGSDKAYMEGYVSFKDLDGGISTALFANIYEQ